MFKQNYVLNYVPENLNTRGFVERGFVAPLSSMLREEELELYSHNPRWLEALGPRPLRLRGAVGCPDLSDSCEMNE